MPGVIPSRWLAMTAWPRLIPPSLGGTCRWRKTRNLCASSRSMVRSRSSMFWNTPPERATVQLLQRLVIPVSDWLVRHIAAGQDDGNIEFSGEQMVHRRVQQHDTQALVSRCCSAGDRRDGQEAQEDDRSAGAGE